MSQIQDAIREFMEDARRNADANVAEAVAYMANVFRSVLPSLSGETRNSVAVVRNGDARYQVIINGPWRFNEFGYIHKRSGKFIPPKPVTRTAFAQELETVKAIIGGEE